MKGGRGSGGAMPSAAPPRPAAFACRRHQRALTCRLQAPSISAINRTGRTAFMIRPLALVGVLSLAAMSGLASAQQPAAPPARAPDMALALEAAQAAVAKCAADNVKAGASIVDSAGVLRIMVSADGASKGAVESSTRKAFTAATLKAATLDVFKKMETDAALKAKLDADTTL